MSYIDTNRYIIAYSKVFNVSFDKVENFAKKRGLNALLENGDMLLTTKAQMEKYKAFLDLYNMSEAVIKNIKIADSAKAAADIARSTMQDIFGRENLCILYLNTALNVIDTKIVSIGDLTGSIATPREIFKEAFLNKAAAIIMVHNHPSGKLEPSDSDKMVTKKMISAGKLLSIDVIDHIIITGLNKEKLFSFAENNLMYDFNMKLQHNLGESSLIYYDIKKIEKEYGKNDDFVIKIDEIDDIINTETRGNELGM